MGVVTACWHNNRSRSQTALLIPARYRSRGHQLSLKCHDDAEEASEVWFLQKKVNFDLNGIMFVFYLQLPQCHAIGNSSCEEYIPLGQSLLHPKLRKNWAKITHFSDTFDNIYQTEILVSLKLGYPCGQGLLPTVCTDEKFPRSVSEMF